MNSSFFSENVIDFAILIFLAVFFWTMFKGMTMLIEQVSQ